MLDLERIAQVEPFRKIFRIEEHRGSVRPAFDVDEPQALPAPHDPGIVPAAFYNLFAENVL